MLKMARGSYCNMYYKYVATVHSRGTPSKISTGSIYSDATDAQV